MAAFQICIFWARNRLSFRRPVCLNYAIEWHEFDVCSSWQHRFIVNYWFLDKIYDEFSTYFISKVATKSMLAVFLYLLEFYGHLNSHNTMTLFAWKILRFFDKIPSQKCLKLDDNNSQTFDDQIQTVATSLNPRTSFRHLCTSKQENIGRIKSPHFEVSLTETFLCKSWPWKLSWTENCFKVDFQFWLRSEDFSFARAPEPERMTRVRRMELFSLFTDTLSDASSLALPFRNS